MGFDKFKSYKATANEPYESKNPYVQKALAAQREANTATPPSGTSGDELKTNGVLISRVNQLALEVKDLKMDIASLLLLMGGDTNKKFNASEARDIYFKFRASEEHLMQRIKDKIDNQGNPNI